jgi:predicted alpha/beta-hydrolase family hydrolase
MKFRSYVEPPEPMRGLEVPPEVVAALGSDILEARPDHHAMWRTTRPSRASQAWLPGRWPRPPRTTRGMPRTIVAGLFLPPDGLRPAREHQRLVRGILVVAVLLVPIACAGSSPGGTSGSSSAPSTPRPSVTTAPSAVGTQAYREVQFTTPDGATRSGRRFGDGRVAIVLSHMGRPGDRQDDWASFAGELARRGYRVLTYQRRDAFEEVWQDVLGAAGYLRDHGADKVIAAGASIGAMASLYAAERPTSNLDGVIWLAGILQGSGYDFQKADVAEIACPMLFISGDQDRYGAAEAARRLHGWTTAPSQLLILPTDRHGTDVFDEGGPAARKLLLAMTRFVQRAASRSRTC